jgi:hypothetical protein
VRIVDRPGWGMRGEIDGGKERRSGVIADGARVGQRYLIRRRWRGSGGRALRLAIAAEASARDMKPRFVLPPSSSRRRPGSISPLARPAQWVPASAGMTEGRQLSTFPVVPKFRLERLLLAEMAKFMICWHDPRRSRP